MFQLRLIEKFNIDTREILKAREALRLANQNVPTLLQLCKAEGRETQLEFRNAKHHADFLSIFPVECLQASPEVIEYQALRREIVAQQESVRGQRKELMGRFLKAKADIDRIRDSYRDPKFVHVGELWREQYAGARAELTSLRSAAEPPECFAGLLQQLAGVKAPDLDWSVKPRVLAEDDEDKSKEEEDNEPTSLGSEDLDDFLDEIEDGDSNIETLRRRRERAESDVEIATARAAGRQASELGDFPIFGSGPDLSRYEGAVDSARTLAGEDAFWTGPLFDPRVGNSAPRGEAPPGSLGGVAPSGGSSEAQCQSSVEQALSQQRQTLGSHLGTPGMAAQLEGQRSHLYNTCLDLCRRNPRDLNQGCFTSCMSRRPQGRAYLDHQLTCQRQCYR